MVQQFYLLIFLWASKPCPQKLADIIDRMLLVVRWGWGRGGGWAALRPADNAASGRVAGGQWRVSAWAGDQPAGDRRRRHTQHGRGFHTPAHWLPRHQHRWRHCPELLRRTRVSPRENRYRMQFNCFSFSLWNASTETRTSDPQKTATTYTVVACLPAYR